MATYAFPVKPDGSIDLERLEADAAVYPTDSETVSVRADRAGYYKRLFEEAQALLALWTDTSVQSAKTSVVEAVRSGHFRDTKRRHILCCVCDKLENYYEALSRFERLLDEERNP